MKTTIHEKLTYRACIEILGETKLCSRLAKASTLPDKYPDKVTRCKVYRYGRRTRIRCYEVRLPHHSREALNYSRKLLLDARSMYLKKIDEIRWIEALGRAVHYIQDYTVPFDLPLRHEIVEYEATRIDIDDIVAKARERVFAKPLYPRRVYMLYERLQPGRDAESAMLKAAYATLLVLGAFFKPDKPPSLKERYKRSSRRHWVGVTALTILGLTGILASLYHPYFVVLGVAGLTAAYAYHIFDNEFHILAFEKRWLYG